MTFTFNKGSEESDWCCFASACWNVQSNLVEFVSQILATIL